MAKTNKRCPISKELTKYCMIGFNQSGNLRALARGYLKSRILKFVKDEESKGNTCVVLPDAAYDDIPKKYITNFYWVASTEAKDKERILKRLSQWTSKYG